MDGKTKQVTRTKLSGPGVYMIRCKANGKVYVGSTVLNIRNRLSTHFGQLRSGRHICGRLQADFTKYGEVNFETAVIAIIDEDDVRNREQQEIAKHKATDHEHGYNTYANILPAYRKPKSHVAQAPVRGFGLVSDADWQEIRDACELSGLSLVQWALPMMLKKARREKSK